MILELLVPRIDGAIDRVRIDKLVIAEGDIVAPAMNLLEFTAGLDFAGMHGCPPTTKYRMTSNETAHVRKVRAREGERLPSDEVLAILSTEPDESLDAEDRRMARHSLAPIFSASAW